MHLLISNREVHHCQSNGTDARSLSSEMFVLNSPESPLGQIFKLLLECFSTALLRGNREKRKKEEEERRSEEMEVANDDPRSTGDNYIHPDSTDKKSEEMIDAAKKIRMDLEEQEYRIVSCTEKWIIQLLTTTSVLLGIMQDRGDGEILMKEIKRKVLLFLNEIWPVLFQMRSTQGEGSRIADDKDGINKRKNRSAKKDKKKIDECEILPNPHIAEKEKENRGAAYDYSGLRDYARAAWIECNGGTFPLISTESMMTSSSATLLPPSSSSTPKPPVLILTTPSLDGIGEIGSISKMGGDESKKRTFLNISGKTQGRMPINDNIDNDSPGVRFQSNFDIKDTSGSVKESLIVGIDDSLQLKLELAGRRARQARVPLTGTGADRANMDTQSQQMEEEEEYEESEREKEKEKEEENEENTDKDILENSTGEAGVLIEGREEVVGILTSVMVKTSEGGMEDVSKEEEMEVEIEIEGRCLCFTENLLHVELRKEGEIESSGEGECEEEEETEIVEDEKEHKETGNAMVIKDIVGIDCEKGGNGIELEEGNQGPLVEQVESAGECADYTQDVSTKKDEQNDCSAAEELFQRVGKATVAEDLLRRVEVGDEGEARAVRNRITAVSLSLSTPFLPPSLYSAPFLPNSTITSVLDSNDTRLPTATLPLPTIPKDAESSINISPHLLQVSSFPPSCPPSCLLSVDLLQPCSSDNHSLEQKIDGHHSDVRDAPSATIATSSQYQDFEFFIASPAPDPAPVPTSLPTITTALVGVENHTRSENVRSSDVISGNKQQKKTEEKEEKEEEEEKGEGEGHEEVPGSTESYEEDRDRGEPQNIEKQACEKKDEKLKEKRKTLDLDLFTPDEGTDQFDGEQSTQLRAEELSSQIIFLPFRGSNPFPSSSSKYAPRNMSLFPRTILQSNSMAGRRAERSVDDANTESLSPSLARSMGAMLSSYINSTDTVARTLQDVLNGDGDVASMSKKICVESDRIACAGSLEVSGFHGRGRSRVGDLGQEEDKRERAVCVSISSPQTLIREALEANHRMSGQLLELSRRYQEDL